MLLEHSPILDLWPNNTNLSGMIYWVQGVHIHYATNHIIFFIGKVFLYDNNKNLKQCGLSNI